MYYKKNNLINIASDLKLRETWHYFFLKKVFDTLVSEPLICPLCNNEMLQRHWRNYLGNAWEKFLLAVFVLLLRGCYIIVFIWWLTLLTRSVAAKLKFASQAMWQTNLGISTIIPFRVWTNWNCYYIYIPVIFIIIASTNCSLSGKLVGSCEVNNRNQQATGSYFLSNTFIIILICLERMHIVHILI